MAECKDCKVSYWGGTSTIHFCALHARAEAYRDALEKIIKRGHAKDCYWNGLSHGCNCHVSIAEQALKGEG